MQVPSWICLIVASSIAPAADLTTLSGKKLSGDITSISAQGIALKTASGDVTTQLADALLVELGSVTPIQAKYSEVELIDGSVLICSAVAFKQQQAELTLHGGPVVSVPLAAVSSLLNDANDPKGRQEWLQLVRKRGQYDLLAVRSDGKLDALDGTFGPGNAGGDAIEFSLANAEQKLNPKLARIQGLVFVRKPVADAPVTPCKVTDTAGNLLVARNVRTDGDAVIVEPVGGGSVRYPSLKSLARLDYSKGKLAYLSDMEPTDKDQSSTEDLVFPFRRDRNLYGGPLRLNGVTYPKGLSIHSRTVLTYDIGTDYNEFRAMLGVDDVVRSENGTPVLLRVVIEGDGRELFRGDVRDRDEPKPIALDVKNVRRLKITVAAPLLDLGNQVDLCDARVTK
jgi:NPCBM/NEW2 domain